MEIIALRCPSCGENLAGLSNDMVFQCRRCGRGFELTGDTFQARDILWGNPKIEIPAPLLFLPFWRFTVSYSVTGEPGEKVEGIKAMERIEQVYVTAFFQRDIFYFGDLGFLYTQSRVKPEEKKNGGLMLGASRGSKESLCYIRLFILKVIDQSFDVTGIDLNIDIQGTCLIGIPFYDKGDTIIDGLFGRALSASSIDDINEIRKFNGVLIP